MLVYRVECKDGGGPYSDQKLRGGYRDDEKRRLCQDLCNAHCDIDNHPSVENDEMDGNTDYFCGFVTAQQLKDWFYGFRSRLRDNGYFMAVYDVPYQDVIYGKSGKQIAFLKDEAKLIQKLAVP